jgi:hypothetical protein
MSYIHRRYIPRLIKKYKLYFLIIELCSSVIIQKCVLIFYRARLNVGTRPLMKKPMASAWCRHGATMMGTATLEAAAASTKELWGCDLQQEGSSKMARSKFEVIA